MPKAEPKFKAPFAGFTRTAEIWNSRACMIGLIGTFIVELVSYFHFSSFFGTVLGYYSIAVTQTNHESYACDYVFIDRSNRI